MVAAGRVLDQRHPRRGGRGARPGRDRGARLARWHAGLEEDIGIAVVRSFIQLTAIGYVITVIFDEDSAALVVALIAVMVVFGAFTARRRAQRVPGAFWPLLISLGVAAAATLGLVARARHLPRDAALPGAGGRDGDRQLDDLGCRRAQPARRGRPRSVPGGSRRPWPSARPPPRPSTPLVRRSLRSGMITLVDSTKTTGLIFFPGTMVGMLLAGGGPDRRGPPPADPPLRAARRGLDRGPDVDHARPAQLLHARPPAARAAGAVVRKLNPTASGR